MRRTRLALFFLIAGIHGLLIFGISFTVKPNDLSESSRKTIQLINISEQPPPVPQPQSPPVPPAPQRALPPSAAPPQLDLAEALPEPAAEPVEQSSADTSGSVEEAGAATAEQDAALAYLQHNFNYIQRRIRDKLVYPSLAKKTGIQGITEMIFTLHQDGSVSGVSVKSSSGQELLDKAAMDAIYAAAPFRPPPPVQARMVIPVAFKLR